MAKAPRYAAKTMLFRCYVIVLQCDALEGRCWCDATAALGGANRNNIMSACNVATLPVNFYFCCG